MMPSFTSVEEEKANPPMAAKSRTLMTSPSIERREKEGLG